jgi:hypothetical protein
MRVVAAAPAHATAAGADGLQRAGNLASITPPDQHPQLQTTNLDDLTVFFSSPSLAEALSDIERTPAEGQQTPAAAASRETPAAVAVTVSDVASAAMGTDEDVELVALAPPPGFESAASQPELPPAAAAKAAAPASSTNGAVRVGLLSKHRSSPRVSPSPKPSPKTSPKPARNQLVPTPQPFRPVAQAGPPNQAAHLQEAKPAASPNSRVGRV